MKIPILLALAFFAAGSCGCSRSEQPLVNTAPPAPIANSTVTPYQRPTAKKNANASDTPCEGNYVVPGVNGAPDEIYPCPPATPAVTPSPKAAKSGNTVQAHTHE